MVIKLYIFYGKEYKRQTKSPKKTAARNRTAEATFSLLLHCLLVSESGLLRKYRTILTLDLTPNALFYRLGQELPKETLLFSLPILVVVFVVKTTMNISKPTLQVECLML